VVLDASLITGIDPPADVESALAAINTAYNQVSSDISLAQAGADQKIVQSKRAVEIETLRAEAETQPLVANGGAIARFEEERRGGAGRLHPQRAAETVQRGQVGSSWRWTMSNLLSGFIRAAFLPGGGGDVRGLVCLGAGVLWASCSCLGFTPLSRSGSARCMSCSARCWR